MILVKIFDSLEPFQWSFMSWTIGTPKNPSSNPFSKIITLNKQIIQVFKNTLHPIPSDAYIDMFSFSFSNIFIPY